MGTFGARRRRKKSSGARSDKELKRCGDGAAQLCEEVTDNSRTDQILQRTKPSHETLVCEDEFQNQVECLEGVTQILDDHADMFSCKLVKISGDTPILNDFEDSSQTKLGILDGGSNISLVHKDSTKTEWVDMEGGTQVPDPEDVLQNQLLKLAGDKEVNENQHYDENLCKNLSDDHDNQVATETLDTLSIRKCEVSSSRNTSSDEMNQWESVSNCKEKGVMEENVRPNFAAIRIASLRASAAAAHRRALERPNSSVITNISLEECPSKDISNSGCLPVSFTEGHLKSVNMTSNLKIHESVQSVNTSLFSGQHFDRKTEVLRKVSSGKMEEPDDFEDDYDDIRREPEDTEVENGKKFRSSAVRKLFAEDDISRTESPVTRMSNDAEIDEVAALAGLSHIGSQEPSEAAQAEALHFVEKFLEANIYDIDEECHGDTHQKYMNTMACVPDTYILVKKNNSRNIVREAKAYDWDDDNEDEGGGTFFCKIKEEILKNESRLQKSLPPTWKRIQLNFDQLEDHKGQPKVDGKQEKMFCFDTSLVTNSMSINENRFQKNVMGNLSDSWHVQPSASHSVVRSGYGSSNRSVDDSKDAGVATHFTATAIKSHHVASHDLTLIAKPSSITKVSTEGSADGRGRKIPVRKRKYLRKRACPELEMVTENCRKSVTRTDGRKEGKDKDASRDEDAYNSSCTAGKLEALLESRARNPIAQRTRQAMLKVSNSEKSIKPIKLPVEASVARGMKISSGDSDLFTHLDSYSSVEDENIGELEINELEQSRSEATHKTIGSSNIKGATICRLNKSPDFEDPPKWSVNQGTSGCSIGQQGLKYDVQTARSALHAHANFDGVQQIKETTTLVSCEYCLKGMPRKSRSSKKYKIRKRAYFDPEMDSGNSLQSTEMFDGMDEGIAPNQTHDDEEDDSCRTVGKPGEQLANMTCLHNSKRTTRASWQNNLTSADTAPDKFVEPKKKQTEVSLAKRSRPGEPNCFDALQVNSKEESLKIDKEDMVQVMPEEEHTVKQTKPISMDKFVCDMVTTSSRSRDMGAQRSSRLNESPCLHGPSLWPLNKDVRENDPGRKISRLETSLSKKARASGLACSSPTNSTKPPQDASPVCIGNEYPKSCKQSRLRSDLIKEHHNLDARAPEIASTLKVSWTRKDMTDVRVLFSRHLDEDTLKLQKKILDRLGASVASSISDATHFVANEFVRTRNMLEAIALGKIVVTPSWLESCSQTRLHTDEKSYILRDTKKEKEYGFSMPVSLDHARQHPLLHKRRVFITPNTKPGSETLSCLVKALRGQVIGRLGRSSLKDKSYLAGLLIITCEEDLEVCEPFLEKGVSVYSSELLLNGIVIQRLEYERYRLFDDYIKETRSTLWLKKDGKQFIPLKRKKQ